MSKEETVELRSVMVPSPEDPDKLVPAFDVPIKRSVEHWSEVELADGTIFRIKAQVLSVAKLAGVVDKQGDPIYFVNAEPLTTMIVTGASVDTESNGEHS